MTTTLSDKSHIPDYLLRVRLSMLLCMVLFALMLGLNHQLLTLLLKSRGYNETAIGISAAMMPLGILVSSFFIMRITSKVISAYAVIGGLLIGAGAMLLLYLTSDYYLWLALRLCLGAGINVTFIIGEAWVNESAKEAKRARTLAIYMTLLSASFAIGPAIVAWVGIHSFTPFAIGIVMALIACVPVYHYRYRYPDFPQPETSISLWSFLPLAPALLFSVFIVTMMDQGLLSLLSVYGLAHGFGESRAVLLVSYLVLGTVLLQYPIGAIADRLPNRRFATLGCALLSVIGFLLIPYGMRHELIYIPLFIFTGGVSFAIYTLGLTEMGHRFSGAHLLAGMACVSFIWGSAGLVSPPISGALMEYLGRDWLMYFMAALYCVLALTLWLRRDRSESIHR